MSFTIPYLRYNIPNAPIKYGNSMENNYRVGSTYHDRIPFQIRPRRCLFPNGKPTFCTTPFPSRTPAQPRPMGRLAPSRLQPTQKRLTPRQVQLIFQYIGEPYHFYFAMSQKMCTFAFDFGNTELQWPKGKMLI